MAVSYMIKDPSIDFEKYGQFNSLIEYMIEKSLKYSSKGC